ncbi:hypothetical protein [Mariniluteicoccus flavus]
MAEVRKFKPGSSPIADAIAKAMGENVRPTTPGAPPAAKPTSAAPAARADIFTSATSGFTIPARPPATSNAEQPTDEE